MMSALTRKSRSMKGAKGDGDALSNVISLLKPLDVCRAVHLNRALAEATALAPIETVLFVGTNPMRASLYLAAAHPEIDFVMVSTNIVRRGYLHAEAVRFGIRNLSVRSHDIEGGPTAPADLVMCGPLFENCVDDAAVARHLVSSAKTFLHVEVSLVSPKDLAAEQVLERAARRGLARPGYTPALMQALFPDFKVVSTHSSFHDDTVAELEGEGADLVAIAERDIRPKLSYSRREAKALMALIDVGGRATSSPEDLAAMQKDRATLAHTSAPQRLSQVLKALAPQSYLEIGVDPDERQHQIPASAVRTVLRRHDDSLMVGRSTAGGVADAQSGSTFDDAVDFVFIDDSRVFEYILRDIARAIPHCHQHSVIAVRYTMPEAEWLVTRGRARRWCGDAWKVLPCLAELAPEISITTIETPDGGLSLLTGFLPAHAEIANEIAGVIDRYGMMAPELFSEHRSAHRIVENRREDIERVLPTAFDPGSRHEPLAPDAFGFPLGPTFPIDGPTNFAVNLVKRAILGKLDRVGSPFGSNRERIRARKQNAGPLPLESKYTMLGVHKVDNLQFCVETVLADRVPGDFIETGVWRGGSCIFMRAILQAHGDNLRTVWVADSFEGLPPPDDERFPADSLSPLHTYDQLAISLSDVQENFRRFGLLDEQVKFLKGWFSDTLPGAPIEKLAIVRLDGDMYESTWDGIVNLYPRLSVGGFVIVDDYGVVPGCREAILDYRSQHNITDPIQFVFGNPRCVYWRRT